MPRPGTATTLSCTYRPMGLLHRSSSLPPTNTWPSQGDTNSSPAEPMDDKCQKYHRLAFDSGDADFDSDLFLSGLSFMSTSEQTQSISMDPATLCWSFSDIAHPDFRLDRSSVVTHAPPLVSVSIQTDPLLRANRGPNLPDLSFLRPTARLLTRTELSTGLKSSNPPQFQCKAQPSVRLLNHQPNSIKNVTFEQPRSYPCHSKELRSELVLRIQRSVDECQRTCAAINQKNQHSRVQLILRHELCMALKELFKDGLRNPNGNNQNILTSLVRECDSNYEPSEDHTELFVRFIMKLVNRRNLARFISGRLLADHVLMSRYYAKNAFLRSHHSAQMRRQMLTDLGRLAKFIGEEPRSRIPVKIGRR
ncbi:hypothetical protein ACOME3_001006 [Neoechinorhynchus agilis]